MGLYLVYMHGHNQKYQNNNFAFAKAQEIDFCQASYILFGKDFKRVLIQGQVGKYYFFQAG